MRSCPVCGQANDDLAVICVSCKGYLQAKVDTLDLFHTIWGLMDAPTATMRRIAIARQKNYRIFLSAMLGIALAFALIWSRSLGRLLGGLGPTVGAGIIVGPFLGLLAVLLISWLLKIVGRILGGHGTMRETSAVVAYAGVPIVISLVVVFPIEIAVFGQYLFDNNPPPLVIDPAAYIGLMSLDALAVLWSWMLLVTGIRIAQRLTRIRAFLASLTVPVVVIAAAAALRLVP